jgi:hypothetical protein
VQPQFSSKSAKLVAKEIGGRVVVADHWLKTGRVIFANLSEKSKGL